MAAPKKGKTSRRTMTAPLKAELGQVNFYSIKKQGEKKAAASSRDAGTKKRVASASASKKAGGGMGTKKK